MKDVIEWVMPKGAWTQADKDLHTKRISWNLNRTVSMAGSKFDSWYDGIAVEHMDMYIDAVAFAVHKYIEHRGYTPRNLPLSINYMIAESGIGEWWCFGIGGESVCKHNNIGRLGNHAWLGIQSRVILNYKHKLLSRVYSSKSEAEWINLAKLHTENK